jgi:hypothetical protein
VKCFRLWRREQKIKFLIPAKKAQDVRWEVVYGAVTDSVQSLASLTHNYLCPEFALSLVVKNYK